VQLPLRAVGETLEAGPVVGPETREGLVGGRTDRDVIGVPEDAVGTQRDDHVGPLLVENLRDRRHHVLEGHLGHAPVRQAEPLVSVWRPADSAPRGLVLRPANGSERLSRGREPLPDGPLLAEGGVDQDEPELGVVGMQRHAPRDPVRVVVRMRDDAGEGPAARHDGHDIGRDVAPAGPCVVAADHACVAGHTR
jgi:hypothetical protein